MDSFPKQSTADPARALPSLPQQIAHAREVSQTCLSRLALSAGIASSETILIKRNQLWGFRFTMANFHAQWIIHTGEILIFQDNHLLERLTLEGNVERRAA